MRYWDTAALAPLLVRENMSAAMTDLMRGDPVVATWWGTRVECASVLARLEREGNLDETGTGQARARLTALAETWTEITPSELLREQAERVLRLHPLRAADALQLAAALVASDLRPTNLTFVSLDHRLVTAAQREGFRVAGSGA